MKLTPAQLCELTAAPGDNPRALQNALYARVTRGDITPRSVEPSPRGGRPWMFFDLADAATFKILTELARVGMIAGTPASAVAILALGHWTEGRPQVGDYASPIEWAIAEVAAASAEMAFTVYTGPDSGSVGIGAAVFDTASPAPFFPADSICRIGFNLNVLLGPMLAKASRLAVMA